MLVLTPQCNSLYLHERFQWVISFRAQSSLIMVIVVSIHLAFYYSGTVYFKEQSHQGLVWLISLSKTYDKCRSWAYLSQGGNGDKLDGVIDKKKKNDVVFGVLYSAPRRNCSTGVEEKVPHCLYYCCIIIVCNIDCELLIGHCQHHVKNSSYWIRVACRH